MLNLHKPLLLLAVAAGLSTLSSLHAAVITGNDTANVNLGSGTNVSYFVVDESTLTSEPIVYAWHYDGSTNPITGTNWSGTDLLNAVVADSSGTQYALGYATDPAYPDNIFITNFTIAGISASYDSTSSAWAYWIKGGSQYVTYSGATDNPLNWSIANDTSDSRWITNGSYDGWTISPFDDSGSYTGPSPLSGISMIPEPTMLPFLALSALSLLIFRWRVTKQV